MTSTKPILYSIPETARLLKVNPSVVRKLCHAGLIRPMKLGTMKISAKEVDRFLDAATGKDLSDPNAVKELTYENR